MSKLTWQKIKAKEIPQIENMLRDIEENYVNACARFILRQKGRDQIWALKRDDGRPAGIAFIYRNMIFPVLCGLNEVPPLKFINGFFGLKNVHHVMGLKNEVAVIQKELEKFNMLPCDVYEYNLMSLNHLPDEKSYLSSGTNLIFRKAELSDIEKIIPLQKGYEEEEVYHKGWTYNAAASKVNIVNIIAAGHMFVAQSGNNIIGKINISAVSFSRYLVGGVYTVPAFRGRGIARRLTGLFCASLINQGKGITLFVKKNNAPAQRLYLSLGFKIKNDFRISYY